MKTFTLLLALYAGALGPSYAVLAQHPEPPNSGALPAFDYACKVLAYDCSNLAPPRVLWEPLYVHGVFGYYDGSDTIHMDNSMLRIADRVYVDSIITHETVHYLDVQLGVIQLPFDAENLCTSEFNAWRVGNAYVITHGRPDLARFDWHIQYGCFQ